MPSRVESREGRRARCSRLSYPRALIHAHFRAAFAREPCASSEGRDSGESDGKRQATKQKRKRDPRRTSRRLGRATADANTHVPLCSPRSPAPDVRKPQPTRARHNVGRRGMRSRRPRPENKLRAYVRTSREFVRYARASRARIAVEYVSARLGMMELCSVGNLWRGRSSGARGAHGCAVCIRASWGFQS